MTRAPADFHTDVNDPVTLEAEERVLEYLRDVKRWSCIDVRFRHVAWDFELYAGRGPMQRLDVKAERNTDTTSRLPFEVEMRCPDGRSTPGWGGKEELDLLAVVGVHTWRCVFVRMPVLRAMVERELARAKPNLPHGWRWWPPRENTNGCFSHGLCIPIDDAWRDMAIFHIADVPGGRL